MAGRGSAIKGPPSPRSPGGSLDFSEVSRNTQKMETFTTTQLANNCGAVIDAALSGTVMITRHRRECVVVLSVAAYRTLTAAAARPSIPQEDTELPQEGTELPQEGTDDD